MCVFESNRGRDRLVEPHKTHARRRFSGRGVKNPLVAEKCFDRMKRFSFFSKIDGLIVEINRWSKVFIEYNRTRHVNWEKISSPPLSTDEGPHFSACKTIITCIRTTSGDLNAGVTIKLSNFSLFRRYRAIPYWSRHETRERSKTNREIIRRIIYHHCRRRLRTRSGK